MTEYDRILHTDGSFLKEEADRILLKAHEMVDGVLAAGGLDARSATLEQLTDAVAEALCRTIIRLEAQAREAERLRVEAQAQFDRGYYDGCANPIVRYDALRDALQHCVDAIASWAKKPEGADPWLLGALDNALEALEQNK